MRRAAEHSQPRIICEGETDPKYLRAAAQALGFTKLATDVRIDWIGQIGPQGSLGGGKSALEAATKTFRYNIDLLKSSTVYLYDLDAEKPDQDIGLMHIRTIVRNLDNTQRPNGIENLLSTVCFEDRFFRDEKSPTNDDEITIRMLDKSMLCEHLCKSSSAEALEGFRPTLEMLERTLFTVLPHAS